MNHSSREGLYSKMGYSEELGGDGTIDNNSSVSDFKISIFNFKYYFL